MISVVGSGDVHVFAPKRWKELAHFEEGGEAVNVAPVPLVQELWGATSGSGARFLPKHILVQSTNMIESRHYVLSHKNLR